MSAFIMATHCNPLSVVTRSDAQPTPQDRLSDFKRKAVYVPELYQVIGNQFTKQFNQEQAQ